MTEPEMQETPQGAEIPRPKRADVLADLLKVAKAEKPSDPDAGSAGDEQGELSGA